jgi:hypothetical protein
LAAGRGDFPVRFQRALTFGLASELSFEYGSLTPSEKRELRAEAETAFMQSKASDRDYDQHKFVSSSYRSRRR